MDNQVLNILQRMDDRQLKMAEDMAVVKTILDHHEKKHKELELEIEEAHKKTDELPKHFWKKVTGIVGLISVIMGIVVNFLRAKGMV